VDTNAAVSANEVSFVRSGGGGGGVLHCAAFRFGRTLHKTGPSLPDQSEMMCLIR
jgi:hypothetical protein